MNNSNTAALVIDVQKGLVDGSYREAEVLEAITKTISKVRNAQGCVFYVQHCHSSWEPLKKGNPGWALHSSLQIDDSDILIEKTASDSFFESALEEQLESRGVKRLIVMGLQTEFCVDAACRAALSKGYNVTLVSDGHTTGNAEISAEDAIRHHNYALGTWHIQHLKLR